MKSLARIQEQIERFRSLARTSEERLFAVDERLSAWSAGQHLDHTIKVATAIIGRVRQENPPVEKNGISVLGRLVLVLGWIPRGRGKAPERFHGTRAEAVDLEAALENLESSLARVVPAAVVAVRTPTVPHPFFGGLTPSQAVRFVAIHNAHHLKIIEEILRSARLQP